MKKNYKYFVKNIGLLSISQLSTKIISFFLIPLYTNILTTEEYGIYDLYSTTISLMTPILTLNIMQSIMRFSLDQTGDKKEILSAGLDVFFKGMLVFIGMVILNVQFNFFPIINQYLLIFILLYVNLAIQEMLVNFARGIDDIAAVSVGGLINSVIMLSLNVLFLIPLHMGLNGYFYSSIIGVSVCNLYIFMKTKIWHYIQFKKCDSTLRKEMIVYAIPLIFNSIAWWINNASDRYVIIALCGVAVNGIYSIAYKIPNILSMFQNIFNQAWTLSAVKDYDHNDSNGFFTRIYNTYNSMMVLMCSALIVGDRIIAKLLYAKDFYEAWKYAPFLLIAIVFGAISGYIGGIFSAVKDSKVYAQSTIIGAVFNIMLNLILVHFFGPIGAAIATAVSFLIVWIIRIFKMQTYIRIRFNIVRDGIAYSILFIQAFTLLVCSEKIALLYVIEGCMFILHIVLYRKELFDVKKLVQQKKKRKN